jgi:UDP-N-acetylmuramate: L-alanyl-gamma-D-glutamyl-meso-diaminopimelate ligase
VIQDKKAVVCAGTHGKTTTTAWTAFLFQELGMDPSYLIGGVPLDLPQGCAITPSPYFVGEGDEYDSAFFDKGPKFLHYHPHCAILANIEFDHADIYRDLAHVQSSFEKLVALLPGDGLCLARHEDPVARAVAQGALCPVQTFGMAAGATWRVAQIEYEPEFMSFELEYAKRKVGWFRTKLFGEHNVANLVSGIAAAAHFGVSIDKMRPIVERFRGAKRRQQILLEEPFTLIDDFAHHPTEVAATLKAVRQRFQKGTLWAFFEPRSATARRGSHQEIYPAAFSPADQVVIGTPYQGQAMPEGQRFSGQTLVEALTAQGKKARCFDNVDDMVALFQKEHQPGDVAVVMSNGEFGKIQTKLKQVV